MKAIVVSLSISFSSQTLNEPKMFRLMLSVTRQKHLPCIYTHLIICNLVFDTSQGNVCDAVKDYFVINAHGKNTSVKM